MNKDAAVLLVAITSAIELYLFMQQRVALEVSRIEQCDSRITRLGLPLWSLISIPNRLARYTGLFFVYKTESLLVAFSFWLGLTIWCSFTPLPYRYFIRQFISKLKNEDVTAEHFRALLAFETALKKLENKGESIT